MRFVCDLLQIALLLLLGYRAVKYAVGKACNGRHRRSQLVRNVGDKLTAVLVGLLQLLGHGVEGVHERSYLAAAFALLLDSCGEVAVCDLA